jgi:archaellum component FlaC
VASELDQINQLINDINNSVGSSDSSQQGGE